MPDPTDPRLTALNSIQDQSRAYGRGRRRGTQANVDPAFQAAIEITEPEARRAALAEYARGRARALFPGNEQPDMPMSGKSLVGQAFPKGDAFSGMGAALPSQASVIDQVDPDAADELYEHADDMRLDARDENPGAAAGGMAAFQAAPPASDGLDSIGDAATALQNRLQARRPRR